MTITTTTIIGFLIPEELEELRIFTQQNDIREWKDRSTSKVISYEQSKTVFITITEEKE